MQAMSSIDERLEKYEDIWRSCFKGSLRRNRCSKEHNKIMKKVYRHLRRKGKGLLYILAEESAEKVLGIDRPDLLAVWEDGGKLSENHRYECIEAQRDMNIETIGRKMLRYGIATDRFSLGLYKRNLPYVLNKWDREIEVSFDGKLKKDYEKSTGLSYPKCFGDLGLERVDEKELGSNTFYFDERRKTVDVKFRPSALQDKLNILFYLLHGNKIDVRIPEELV